ncbi:DegT/DnrJ/EryC1/StrS family aminotransferase [uncultured Maribacter sp.]|uniref:DegT/DnrJ/EryC1/StrS family aminotransferase n=1 Tax=uncultured Maribacter sp. TaxID=431308 RepID=UPI00262FBDA9|nr:DegT/DnrJ/EryC1/StrS family aminotransferase [uncultured Maribacter sp.]
MPGFELFGEEEKKQVNDVLETGVLMRYGFDGMRNGQWKAKEFEKTLATRMESKHVQMVSSGTAALTVALASAGIGAGDEVIMPTFTFVASFESILALGAVPILVDVDDTLTLNPAAVENAITPRTKVVMPVHMCGSMADLKALKAICDTHNLLLLEDACQAIGGTFEGKPLGSYGDLGCFSFDFVKTITSGEGGAIITNNEKYYTNADHYSDHGHDHVGNDRGAESHPFLGYNYRISELHAAVGIAQLRRLDSFLERQKKYYNSIRKGLAAVPEITFRTVPNGGVENYSFISFFMPSQELAEKAHKALGEAGVDACFYWFNNNWHYYKKWEHLTHKISLGKLSKEVQEQLPDYSQSDFSLSDKWVSRNISCLVKLSWTEEEVEMRVQKMVKAIKSVLS